MIDYASHFSTLKTPQTERADKRQVQNSAGGYSFQLDCFARLDRWLILGCEGGTYYTSERKLTIENAQTIIECLNQDGVRAVARIVEISESGRAPKNDPAIFALAIACGHENENVRRIALTELPKVCRTGTHLFQFVEAVKQFRGWGRGLRKAVAGWYSSKKPDALAYQVLKYQNRNGWSHKDVLRLCHAELKDTHQGIARWIVGASARDMRTVKRGDRSTIYHGTGNAPEFLEAYAELKAATSEDEVVKLIIKHRFTHEMIPNEWKNSARIWGTLLVHMPIGALVRNLGKMTSVGLLKPLSDASAAACDKLANVDQIKKARLHPISILSALKVYQQGHGEKGKLSWSPVRQIVDALDEAFYASFQTIEPTGKRVLLALDVSGSMESGTIAGCPGLTPRVASAAMAMVTTKAEKNWHCVGFSSGMHGEYVHGRGSSMHYGYRAGLSELGISPRQRLDDVIRTIAAVPMGGTDCALPMLYAAANGLEVDSFQIYTDNETWAGNVHPHQALKTYRAKTGINAKLTVVGMTATQFTIADPNDPGQMDIVGFDSAAPSIIADFIRS